jgi:alpha-L-fucosidase 2
MLGDSTRREFVHQLLTLAAAGPLLRRGEGEAPSAERALELTYGRPARRWVEALPVGNGRLGAMVFGGVGHERLQLNEDTLWTGGPYSQANPEARPHLDEVQSLIFAGRYAEA